MPHKLACLTTALALISAPVSRADCALDAMLVFDGSGSMATLAAQAPFARRIDDARDALRRALPDITPFRRVGLVVYGPGAAAPCANVSVEIQPRPNAQSAILSAIQTVEPEGDTPLTQAVDAAAQTLINGSGTGIVVLITDGRETCGDPCTLAARYGANGITVHVIGFKINENFERWPGFSAEEGELKREPARCLADQTGGIFVLTDTVSELVEALRETLGCAIVSRGPTAYRPVQHPA